MCIFLVFFFDLVVFIRLHCISVIRVVCTPAHLAEVAAALFFFIINAAFVVVWLFRFAVSFCEFHNCFYFRTLRNNLEQDVSEVILRVIAPTPMTSFSLLS